MRLAAKTPIVQLDYGFSWEPNTSLQGTFRDIDLTPMPLRQPL